MEENIKPKSRKELLEELKNVEIVVSKTEYLRCARCKKYCEEVGHRKDYPDLCHRCAEIVWEDFADQFPPEDIPQEIWESKLLPMFRSKTGPWDPAL